MGSQRGSRRAWSDHLASVAPGPVTVPRPAVAGGSAIARVPARRINTATLRMDLAKAKLADGGVPAVQVVPMCAVGKPRMTQRDRWIKRPSVLRYRAFCDELRVRGIRLPNRYGLIFLLPMLPSWSGAMKAAMNGTPHLRRPDKDNLEKAVADALKARDETIWDGAVLKYWAYEPRIIIIKRDDTSSWAPTEMCDPRWLPAGPAG